MVPSITIREYIRWLPEHASEPTRTLVLTSSQNRFIDVRIYRPKHGSDVQEAEEDVLPNSRLEWAFAGTSTTAMKAGTDGDQVVHSTWHHWVDSRTDEAEKVQDQGDMYSQSDGTVLEKGSMVNPATGQHTNYEECWKDLAPRHVGNTSHNVCIVLQLHDDAHRARGMVIRLAQYVQGVLRVGDSFSVERWEWDGEAWKRQSRIGDLWMPCGPAMDDERLKMGGEVKYGDFVWRVVELERF